MKKVLLAALLAGLTLLCACKGSVDFDVRALAEAAIGAGDLPKIVEVTDSEMLSDTIGLNVSELDDYAVYQNMMSVDLAEIIVVKAKNGCADTVKDTLKARKDVFSEQAQFYPQQAEAAEQTIVGQSGDCLWLLCCRDSDKAESAIKERLK